MADRVSASIVIGGALSIPAYSELATLITVEGLSTEWDGEPFAPEQRTIGEPLRLYAHEVAWGIFEALEAWCANNRLPFTRWCGGHGSEWGPQRIVSDANGHQTTYTVTEDDEVVIGLPDVDRLGSLEAVRAHFSAAEVAVPALVVEGDDPEAAVSTVDPVIKSVTHGE